MGQGRPAEAPERGRLKWPDSPFVISVAIICHVDIAMPTDTPSRFVVLRHNMPAAVARSSHWDFMLEVAEHRCTWALESEPATQRLIAARPLADHRLHYLDYEGPISGNRGEVSRWDAGHYAIEQEQDGELTVRLMGGKLIGRATLSRQRPDDHLWTFSFVADSESA